MMASASIHRTAGSIFRSKSLNTVSFVPTHDVTPNMLRQPPKLRTPSTLASTHVGGGSALRSKSASTVSFDPSHDTTPDILPPVPKQREIFDPLTSRSQLSGPPFKQGGREVFLPYFVVAMIKTSMPPNYAKFLVPLTFNKLDLRDYLYNVYGVSCFNIRVYVEQQRARIGKPVPFGERRMWFRPRARKFMTVELDKPFVWPDAPDNTAAYVYLLFIYLSNTDYILQLGQGGQGSIRQLPGRRTTTSRQWPSRSGTQRPRITRRAGAKLTVGQAKVEANVAGHRGRRFAGEQLIQHRHKCWQS